VHRAKNSACKGLSPKNNKSLQKKAICVDQEKKHSKTDQKANLATHDREISRFWPWDE
jgi:hypothetical protein